MSRGFSVFHRQNLVDLLVAEIEARQADPALPSDDYGRGYLAGYIAALRFLARALGVRL